MIILVYLVLYDNIFFTNGCYHNKNFQCLFEWSKIFMSVYQCYENKQALMISSPQKQKSL